MTPEQVCEVLRDANCLNKVTHVTPERSTKKYQLPCSIFSLSPSHAIADGNVAMAAWKAIAKKANALRMDQSRKMVLDVWWHDGLQGEYITEGTDTAAFTTACAMALAEVEG